MQHDLLPGAAPSMCRLCIVGASLGVVVAALQSMGMQKEAGASTAPPAGGTGGTTAARSTEGAAAREQMGRQEGLEERRARDLWRPDLGCQP